VAVGPLQDAAVLTADLLLSPIPTEPMSAREFVRGTLGMLERLQPMSYLGITVAPLYGVLYRVDRTRDATNVAREMREATTCSEPDGMSINILEIAIPSAVAWRKAATLRIPVNQLSKYPMPKLSLMGLVAELFPDFRPVMQEVG
jgi:chromosome partitioning related protein ParA